MQITTGMLMFYGGIAGAAVLALIALILIPVFRHQRKKLLGEIRSE